LHKFITFFSAQSHFLYFSPLLHIIFARKATHMNSDKFHTPNPHFASHLGLPEIHIPIKAKFPAQIAPSKSVPVCAHLNREHLSNPSLRQHVASAKSVQTHCANLQQIHPQRTASRSQEIPNLRQAKIPAQHTPAESVHVCAHLNREHLSNPSLRQQVTSLKSVQTHSANLQQIHPQRTAPRSQEIPNLRQAKIPAQHTPSESVPVCAHLHRERLSNPSFHQQVTSAKSVQTHCANHHEIHPVPHLLACCRFFRYLCTLNYAKSNNDSSKQHHGRIQCKAPPRRHHLRHQRQRQNSPRRT
jgi:hypothetical protein